MASLTTVSANDLLNQVLRNVVLPWAGSTKYMSLHSGSVGLGGDQTTNEIAYTGYARVAVTTTTGGIFDAAASGATQNNAPITFGNPTAGTFPITVTHIGIGANPSGAGTCIEFTALDSPLVINLNVQPNLATGTLDFTMV